MGVGVGVGVGHGGLVGHVLLPATATALMPSGPVEAYAQEVASATPAGAPTSAQVSVATAKARAARAG
ncbi:hypothetical protein ABZ322_35075 [Streptomyces sp. NPDC006129]|uniref:hypothetical protein n=1 Tax=unclassified Streptomyces TaxID=2593676 RepID=UPI0033274548